MIDDKKKEQINRLLEFKHKVDGKGVMCPYTLTEAVQEFEFLMPEYYKDRLRNDILNYINAELTHIWEEVLLK